MRSLLLSLLMALSLQAQVWEDAKTLHVANDAGPGAPLFRWKGDRLERFWGPNGVHNVTGWDFHAGATLLCAVPRHPVYSRQELKGWDAQRLLSMDLLPRELWSSRDFRSWKKIGHWPRDSHGHLRSLHPLEDGSFLALGGLFWDGDSISPFARYRLDSQQVLRFSGLIEPGFGEPLYTVGKLNPTSEMGQRYGRTADLSHRFSELWRGEWELARTPRALVALHRISGWMLRLDPVSGRVIHRVHPYPEKKIAELNRGGGPLLLWAHSTPEGALLLAFRQPEVLGGGYTRWQGVEYSAPEYRLNSPSSRLAHALIQLKERKGGQLPERFTQPCPEIRWFRLDPSTGELQAIPAPPGAPTRLTSVMDTYFLPFRVKPDGSVIRENHFPDPEKVSHPLVRLH